MKQYHVAYQDGKFPPLGGTPALLEASETEMRVLLSVIEENGVPADLAKRAGCSQARASSALSYWKEYGVLAEGQAAPKKEEPLREMGGKELASAIDEGNLKSLLDACSRRVGKELNQKEIATLVGIIEEYGVSEGYVYTLLGFCQKKADRFSFSYMQKAAYTLFQDGVVSEEALSAYISRNEFFTSKEWQIRKLFGIGERAFTKKEKAWLDLWINDYGYDEKIIGIAYDIAVNQTGKLSLAYMGKLLEKWHLSGCTGEDGVNALLAKERAERPSPKQKPSAEYKTGIDANDPSGTKGASFRAADFMEAALRRSYGEEAEDD